MSSNSNDKDPPPSSAGGRPPTEDEKEKIDGIIEMLRQQNLNVTSIPLNGDGTGSVDASGRVKHAFWDTQVNCINVQCS